MNENIHSERIKKKKHRFLIFSIIFFVISVVSLYTFRFECYLIYERVVFESSNATLYANLYHPIKQLNFQQKSPLVIFAHGLGSQKDLDPRVPNEFTKRGFYVASIDYRGDGESGGHLLDMNPSTYMNRTNVPSIAQDCSKLLDTLSHMRFFSHINTSQIGLVGHSLGGMVALMNGAFDERFKVTVTWASLVNFSASFFGITEDHPFMKYIPAKIINESNPSNLMIIHSIYDTTVPFKENALLGKNLTNCKLIEINSHLFGGPHYLFSDKVITETIKWFELKFFNSETINGPISLSYVITYIFIGLSFIGLFLTTLAIMRTIFKYFSIKNFSKSYNEPKESNHSKKISKLKNDVIVVFCFLSFLFLWIVMLNLIGIISLLITPIIFLSIYFLFILIKYVITAEVKGEKISVYIELRLKDEIKSQFHKNVLLYSLLSSGIFLSLYVSFSLAYPFAFFSPANLLSYILTFEIYPFYLAMELFYRKIIYPRLDFIKSATNKTIFTSLLELTNIFLLFYFSGSLFLISAMLVTYLIFLAVMVMNSIIYERTNKFSSVMISSFIIIQIFFGSVVSTILGFGSIVILLHI
ncbi:MAG: alpha/beta hydrolase family protein [Candidatus Thorarchaeota archaeon]